MSDNPDKKRYPHHIAMGVAIVLVETLRPYVERIEIAGSLRRRKPMVGDIEILMIPKLTLTRDLLGEVEGFIDQAAAMIELLEVQGGLEKRPSKIGVFTWGPSNKLSIHVPSGIPVDFFSTDAPCWFNALVCRTGGLENNLLITTTARKRGYSFEAYGSGFEPLTASRQHHQTTSERDVYDFIGLKYLEPEERK